MKNKLFFIAIAMLFMAVGCIEHEVIEEERARQTFTFTAATPDDGVKTRVTLVETQEGDISVTWKSGDNISLCFVSGATVKTLSNIALTNIRDNGKKADFSFTLPAGISYPFDMYGVYGATLTPDSKTVTFPAATLGSALSDSELVCVMSFAAENITAATSLSVNFTHLGAVLGVWMTNTSATDYSLTSLSLTGNDSYNWLYNAIGQATYDITTGVFIDNKAGTTVDFPLGTGTTIAAGATTKVYQWIVPTATPDTSKTITSTLDGTAMTQALPAKAFAAGKYYRLRLAWTGTEWKHLSIPPASSLIRHWKFDGNANNSIEDQYHGTVDGATLTDDRAGNPNSAYSFNGKSHIRVFDGNATAFGQNSFSCNVWANSTQSGLGNLLRTDNSYTDNGWFIRFTYGKIRIWEGRTQGYSYQSASQYNDGIWHMITYVRDVENRQGILYVDGNRIGNYDITGTVNNVSSGNGVWIGSGRGVEYYIGKIDDARIYDRALTDNEVLTLYLMTK